MYVGSIKERAAQAGKGQRRRVIPILCMVPTWSNHAPFIKKISLLKLFKKNKIV